MNPRALWNNFKAWVYHVTHGIKDCGSSLANTCPHCYAEFKKWQKEYRPKENANE